MTEATEQLKSEISDQYLKDFKDELWWMKSLALLPIEEKVKKILTGAFQLPEKFDEVKEFGWWKDIINFVSPSVANQIFDFMKAKRLEIEKRKTEDELRKLKAEILWESVEETAPTGTPASTPDTQTQNSSDTVQTPASSDIAPGENVSSNINSALAWAGTAAIWVLATKWIASKLNARELQKMAENFDTEKAKNLLNNAIDALEKQKQTLASRLSTKQIANIDKHIAKLKEGMTTADDDVIKLLKAWQQLDTKLPKKLLVEAGLSVAQLAKIEKLAPQLIGKESQALKAILDQNGLKISDDIISALAKAGTEAEIKTMTRILKHGSKINRFTQAFAGAMLIDVACLGLDVWMYLETQKEADLIAKVNELRAQNKRNQATTQLWIGIGSVAAEVAIILTAMSGGTAVWGPFGTVAGLVVGGLSAAASMGVDSLYFDVQDFYKQNREDFLRQKQSQLNQAILQGLHNQKEGDKSLNEKLWSPEPSQKAQSLQDAIWSRIFLDELQNGNFASYGPFWEYVQSGEKKADFVDKLTADQSAEFRQKREEISLVIAKRMEYVNQELKKTTVMQALKQGRGMQAVSTLITQSKAYAELTSQDKRNQKLSFEQNLAKYKSNFFADFPKQKLEKLEKIKKSDPYLFQELMATASLSSLIRETQTDLNYDQNVKLVAKYQEWLDLTAPQEEKIKLKIPDSAKNMRFIEKFLEADFEVDKVAFLGNSADQVKNLIHLRQERNAVMEISDGPIQNALYRLAKELYGYTGANEKEDLMAFYDESNGAVHGIYYKDARKVNEDWAIDSGMKMGKWTAKLNSEAEINQYVASFMSRNFETIDQNGHSIKKSAIDTPTETIDSYLQEEFETQFARLLKEELLTRTPNHQNKVKNQISSFVQQQAKNGEYVELPYYLLLAARQAGLGDLQKHFYTRKNGKMEVVMLPSELNNAYGLDAKKTYLTKTREHFSEQEQIYIQRVENAHQLLENLRNLGGTAFLREGFEDELDLPAEIEVLISDKYKEWNAFKSDILLYSAESATSSDIVMKYQAFAEYFEHLYRGILLSLGDFKMSNDVDSFALYRGALSLWSQNLFDENGGLKSDLSSSFLQNEQVKTFYAQQLNKHSIWGKTLAQLRSSEESKEQSLAKRASEAILTAILEQSFLKKAKDGKITSIAIGGHWLDTDKNSFANAQTEALIQQKLAQLQNLPDLDKNSIATLQTQQQTIKPLTQHEEKLVPQVSAIQKQIEATMSEVVWQGKRGNLTYDPEQSTISSRNNTVGVEIKGDKLYLKGLDLAFSPQELAWFANFRNRVKHKYQGKTLVFARDLMNTSFSFRKTFVVDGTMLIARWDLEKHLPCCKDDAVMQKMLVWLNSALK